MSFLTGILCNNNRKFLRPQNRHLVCEFILKYRTWFYTRQPEDMQRSTAPQEPAVSNGRRTQDSVGSTGTKGHGEQSQGPVTRVQHLWLDSRSPGNAELPEGLVTENGMLENSVQSEQDQTRTWAKLVFCFSFFPKNTLKRGRFIHTWELLKV